MPTAIIAFSTLYVLAGLGFTYAAAGVIRPPIPWTLWLLAAYFGAACVWLVSLAAMVYAVRVAIRRQHARCAVYTTVALVACASPFVLNATYLHAAHYAEMRDLRRVGVATLRSEATMLAKANRIKEYPLRWFGGEVPKEDLPPGFASLSAQAAYVTTADEGTVVVTDGLGGWRGGYMITPPGSTFIPESSRQIADGIFYVVTR